MARLGIEPRPTGYIPGALPLGYLAWGNQSEVGILYGLPLFCHFEFIDRLHIQYYSWSVVYIIFCWIGNLLYC